MNYIDNDPLPCVEKGKKFLRILLILDVMFGNIFLLSIICYQKGGWSMSGILRDIIVSVISSVFISIAVTAFAHYKYLKDIPEQTKKKIESFLNERLKNDTTNHNALLRTLNPDNHELAEDHRQLQYRLDDIIKNVEVLKNRNQADYSLLDDAGKRIIHNVEELSKFSLLFEDVYKRNLELTQQNHKLCQKIEELEHINEVLQTGQQGKEQNNYPDFGLEYR